MVAVWMACFGMADRDVFILSIWFQERELVSTVLVQ